jgi:hypothetical protein
VPAQRPRPKSRSRVSSAQTQRTYAGAYRRFAAWPSTYTSTPDPPLTAFTADTLAAYLDELEDQGRASGTITRERAALNRLAKHLHTLGAINTTAILLAGAPGAPGWLWKVGSER